MAQTVSKTTTDHDTIRKWTEQRGGWPAQVASAGQGREVRIIRIDFPGYIGEEKLERISWDDWFRKFDESGLAFVYEDTTAGGQRSSFNKLVRREAAEARAERAEAAHGEAAESAETAERAGRERRPRSAGSEKRGGHQGRRAGSRRQTARAAAARTAGRAGRRGAHGGRRPPRAKPRSSKASTSGGRRGSGRSKRSR